MARRIPFRPRPQACLDCINIHGDTAAQWLAKWPAGAEYRRQYRTCLCDGCADERQANEAVEDRWDLDYLLGY